MKNIFTNQLSWRKAMYVALVLTGLSFAPQNADATPKPNPKMYAYQLVEPVTQTEAQEVKTYYTVSAKHSEDQYFKLLNKELDNVSIYEVTEYTNGDERGKIIMRELSDDEPTPDFLDGTKYRFTDKVLLDCPYPYRGKTPYKLPLGISGWGPICETYEDWRFLAGSEYVSTMQFYRLYINEEVCYTEDNRTDITQLKDGWQTDSFYAEDYDQWFIGHSFRKIVREELISDPKFDPKTGLNEASISTNYRVYMESYEPMAKLFPVGGVVDDGKNNATTIHHLVVPEPVLNNSQVEVFFGKDNNDTSNNSPEDFIYVVNNGDEENTVLELKEARYQNVREVVDIEYSNVNDELGEKMRQMADPDNSLDTKYGFKFTLGEDFIDLRDREAYIVDQGTDKEKYIPRGGDMIGHRVKPSALFSEEDGPTFKTVAHENLLPADVPLVQRWKDGIIASIDISKDKPNLRRKEGNEEPEDELADHMSFAKVKASALYYTNVEDEKNQCLVNDIEMEIVIEATNENYIKHDRKDVEDDTLLHHDTTDGRYDYYLINIVEVDTDGNESLVYDIDGNPAQFVAKVEEINSENTTFTYKIRKNYGPYWDGQLASAQADKFFDRVEIRVSYLYPFHVTHTDKVGMRRMEGDLTGEVLKSDANTLHITGEVLTSVERLPEDTYDHARAGVGYIDVTGKDVVIFNTEGMKVASGEGRHNLNPGIYMVRLSNRVQKVIVK